MVTEDAVIPVSRATPLAAPLPEPLSLGGPARDEVLDAWRRIVQADAGGDPANRAEARVRLIDAWLQLDAASPAAELLREVESFAPRRADVQRRRAQVLLRGGQLREWAQLCAAMARRNGTVEGWEEAVRAWVRADDLVEAAACADALARVAPSETEGFALRSAIARLRAGAQRAEVSVETLLENAHRARESGRVEVWRALSVDAWIESHGARGGELLVEALASAGHPRAAVYVAIETAARTLTAEALGPATESAVRLLVRAARLAESAAMLGEATAAWTVAALLPDDRRREAIEALRDLLAERGRVMDLAARLRADARRVNGSSAAAAWKGVAAVELPVSPGLAVQALLRALVAQPDDVEAKELLQSLEGDAIAEEAMRDGLWSLLHSPCSRVLRAWALSMLGALEERLGDPSSALLAWAALDEPRPEVFEAIARVHASAEQDADAAQTALAELARSGSPEALTALLDRFSDRPGAFTDLRTVTRVLGPLAADNARVAKLWWQVAARRGDLAHFMAVARRVAAHAEDEGLRWRALHACADAVAESGADDAELSEFVALLRDDRPEDPYLAAMLAAIAEQARTPAAAREALEALACVADDPWERDVLARFCQSCSGEFAVFAGCLAEPTASPERIAQFAHLNELVGDSATLLALRTRALLAQTSGADEALLVARRFAAFDPLSAEAAIAWFGAASVAGVAADIASAAEAVVRSLATYRDIASVSRSAVARLVALGQAERAAEVALLAARSGALTDRGLRAAVAELAARETPGSSTRLLECALAVADSPAECGALLSQVAARYEAEGAEGPALGAWLRASAYLPRESLTHLLRLAPRVGDRVWNAQLLSQRLDATLDAAARRRLLLAIAAEYAATEPPRLVDAMGALDRIASEQRDPDSREVVVRAMLSLAQTDAAIGRLSRWAVEQPDPRAVSGLLIRAARLADDGLGDPGRALGLLRGLLRNEPSNHEALQLAETISRRAGLSSVMLAIYADLLDRAAGPHGRFALRYRRALLHEQSGDTAAALQDYAQLLEERPGTGAVLTALERLARSQRRWEVILHALETIAAALPSGLPRAKVYRRAAQVARDDLGDRSLALQHSLLAYQSATSIEAADELRREAAADRDRDPTAADNIINALVDEQLAQGNQCWDDDARRQHALRALEISLADGRDGFRVAASVGLYLRQHEDPAEGAGVVRDLALRVSGDPAMRDAALLAPSMRAISSAPSGAVSSAPPGPALPPAPPSDPPSPERGVYPPSQDVTAEPLASSSWVPPAPRSSVAQFDDSTLMALRAAAAHGNDAAASVLASRLSSSEDLRDEALALQRRRFHDDPSRLDALESMAGLYRATRRTNEAAAVTQVLLALEGRAETVLPPELSELSDPPEGVARLVFPPRFGLYPELGGMLWEVLSGAARRSQDRARFVDARRVVTASTLGRTTAAAVRLLQLPRATSLALRDAVEPGWQLDPSTAPPTVVIADAMTEDTVRMHDVLGAALESTRVGHLPVTVFAPADAARWVRATVAAFSSRHAAPADPAVSALAGQLVDGLPARLQRRMTEIVDELGDALTFEAWRDKVHVATGLAGLLVCGTFEASAARLIGASAHAGARPADLIATWEPLRELVRFATSEEYLMLRWPGGVTRRRSPSGP